VFGEDPRQGYLDGSVFYHPELKFSFPLPAKWALQNYPSEVRMASEDGNAMILFTLAAGASLQAAADQAMKDLQLEVTGSRPVTVNGLPGLEVDSRQVQADQATGTQLTLSVRSTFITYEGRHYVFHCAAMAERFTSFDAAFRTAALGFLPLTAPARLNVKPDRIRVVPVKQAGTFDQALTAYQVPADKRKTLEILNQHKAGDRVEQGDLIKILGQ